MLNDSSAAILVPMSADTEMTLLPDQPVAVRARLALLLYKTGQAMFGTCEDELDGVGLDVRDYMALAILSEEQPRSQLELAQMTGAAPAMVVAIADKLEQQGLVVRERDPADRRRSIVTITKAGRTALARADRLAAQSEAEVLSGLDEHERDALLAALQKATPAPTAA
jgi:DNA-binding MarR family transcriptional regulator